MPPKVSKSQLEQAHKQFMATPIRLAVDIPEGVEDDNKALSPGETEDTLTLHQVDYFERKLAEMSKRMDTEGLEKTVEMEKLNYTILEQAREIHQLRISTAYYETQPLATPSKGSTFMNRSYTGLQSKASKGILYSPDTRKNVSRMDISNSVLKNWQLEKLGNNVLGFPEWHRKAVSYLTAVGLVALVWFDPFKVPNSVEGWEKLGKAAFADSEGKDHYDKLYDRALNGHDYSDLVDKTDVSSINLAFVASINARPGLNSSIATALESTLDITDMDSVLLDTEESASIYSSRLLFFRIYNHFMLNTENSRLERLNFVTSELAPAEGESLRAFVKRLKREVKVLNMMSSKQVVPEDLMVSRFKLLTMQLYGANNPRYEIELSLLKQNKPSYTLDDLVDIWEPVWLETQTHEGSPHATALFTRHKNTHTKGRGANKQNRGRTNKNGKVGTKTYKQKVYSMSDNELRSEKKKLSKDKDGKLLCWQFLKEGDCSFGKDCKFSHKPQSNKVFVVFSQEEIQQQIIDQVVMFAKQQRHSAKKFKRKFERSKSSSKSSKAYVANDDGDSGKRTVEDAVRNHKKRLAAEKSEKANVAHEESKHSGSSDSDASSSCESSSTIDSSGSEEFTGMITNNSESECKTNDVAYLDSGATVHLCGDRRKFKTYRKCSVRIMCANGEYMYSEGIGDIHITLNGKIVILKDVLHLKGAPNLISTNKLVNSGDFLLVMSKGRCDIVKADTDEVLHTSTVNSHRKLYEIPLQCDYTESINLADTDFDAESWTMLNEPYVGEDAPKSASTDDVSPTDSL